MGIDILVWMIDVVWVCVECSGLFVWFVCVDV